MAIFVILFTFSLAFYIFYKAKAIRRQKQPYQKAWINAKGSIALGLAMVFFGTNALILNPTTAIIVICSVLIAVGAYFVFQSFRAYRYFTPLAAQEAKQSKNKD